MDLTSRIGIAVSGCKNGYAVLAVENMDSGSPLLKQGLRDQRNFMRITEPGHDFFTMTITSEAVVLSACRSSVDAVGSSGGYIAVSVFVPVYMQAKGAATLLRSMLEAYWAEYMHPMFGSPLRDKFESAFKLREMLAAASGSFTMRELRYRVFPSETQKSPLLCEYGDVAEVDAVMANPFHRQYARGAEVIFVPRGFMNTAPVNHNLDPVEYVTPQRSAPLTAVGRLMLPPGALFSLADYMVNGKPYRSPSDVSIDSRSTLSYTLVLPGGGKKHFEGTLRDAERRGIITRKGDDYEILPPRMSVRLAVAGVPSGISLGLDNGRREPAEGLRGADGLYEFKIPCSGFPYSLVETKGGKVHRVLSRDVVTDRSVGQDVTEVNVMESALSGSRHSGGTGFIGGARACKFSLTRPMLIAIGAVALALVIFLVWLLFLRTPDVPEQPEPTPSGQTSPDKKHAQSGTPGADMSGTRYCYLIIPSETIAEAIPGWKSYDLTSDILSDLPGAGIYYDKDLRVEVIRIPAHEDLNLKESPLKLVFLKKGSTKEVIGTLELSGTNLPEGAYKDLLKYPSNSADRYVVVPGLPLDNVKYQEYKAFDPEGKDYKPLVHIATDGEGDSGQDDVHDVSVTAPAPKPAPSAAPSVKSGKGKDKNQASPRAPKKPENPTTPKIDTNVL